MNEIAEPVAELVADFAVADGLTIELNDLSRKLAGDRFLFLLEARMDIPLAEAGLAEPVRELLERVFGPALPYTHRYERNFVDQNDLEGLKDRFKAEFETSLLPYLRREGIKDKIIQAKIRELKGNFWKFNLSPNDVACLV